MTTSFLPSILCEPPSLSHWIRSTQTSYHHHNLLPTSRMTIPTQVVWRQLQTTATQTPVAPLPFAAVVIVKTAMTTRTTFEFWHSAIILLYLGLQLSRLLLPSFLQLLLFSGLGLSLATRFIFGFLDNWFRHFFGTISVTLLSSSTLARYTLWRIQVWGGVRFTSCT